MRDLDTASLPTILHPKGRWVTPEDGLRYETINNTAPWPDAVYSPIPPTIEERKSTLLSALADKRWQKEVGGFLFHGKTVMSDRESQSKIQGLSIALAAEGETFGLRWKCANNEWLYLTASTAQELIFAALTHVQEQFNREGELSDQISAATTNEELDALTTVVNAF